MQELHFSDFVPYLVYQFCVRAMSSIYLQNKFLRTRLSRSLQIPNPYDASKFSLIFVTAVRLLNLCTTVREGR